MDSIRNIGIIAHVDAGKTTITEQMLYHCGEMRKLGSVDNGTSVTDSLQVEKERGISVRAATIQFEYKNTVINLIDTPGHGDFIAEVERSLSVLDGVIIVLSAAEGIEAQTPLLWHYLQKLHIPVIFFINKIDRITSDVDKVIEDISREFTDRLVVMQKPVSETTAHADISTWNAADESWQNEFVEKIAEEDDDLLMKYLDGEELLPDDILSSLRHSSCQGKLFPLFMGAAKLGTGIKELLEAVLTYLPAPQIQKIKEPFMAKVYKVIYDPSLGKLCCIRSISGSCMPRDLIKNVSRGSEEKINQIFLPKAGGYKSSSILKSGSVAVVSGLKTAQSGDYLGALPVNESPLVPVSPFMVQVTPLAAIDYARLADALEILNSEEPNLEFVWDKDERTFTINVMGYIHIQILQQTIKDRFAIDAELSEPQIIYKETPLKAAEGYDEYTMPKPCWAVCRFQIKPAPTGSGVSYTSSVSVDKIAAKYQKEVQRTIPQALKQGIHGWEVTDLKINLIDGEDHEIHSRPGNFAIATNLALMKALQKSGTTLLEPVLEFDITIAEDKCGRVMSDILKMRGSYQSPVFQNGFAHLKGKVPAATSADYQITLSSISSGKAAFQTRFYGYEPCDISLGKTRQYKGVNPLDRAKYILKMRGAVTEAVK